MAKGGAAPARVPLHLAVYEVDTAFPLHDRDSPHVCHLPCPISRRWDRSARETTLARHATSAGAAPEGARKAEAVAAEAGARGPSQDGSRTRGCFQQPFGRPDTRDLVADFRRAAWHVRENHRAAG